MNENQELITIKQLPVIEERLKLARDSVKARTDDALSRIVTEDTVKEIKALRAELNKEYKDFEDQRKRVKKEVLAPYEAFERVYKENIGDIYRNTDTELSTRIMSVEVELKDRKRSEIQEYFDECMTANEIDFATFEDAGVNVTLSASVKKLKEQVKKFSDKLKDDVLMIETQEDRDRILSLYKNRTSPTFLNAYRSIATVSDEKRNEAIEAEKRKRKEEAASAKQAFFENWRNLKEKHDKEEKEEKRASALKPPIQTSAEPLQEEAENQNKDEKKYKTRFWVEGTIPELTELKKFLESRGLKYGSE